MSIAVRRLFALTISRIWSETVTIVSSTLPVRPGTRFFTSALAARRAVLEFDMVLKAAAERRIKVLGKQRNPAQVARADLQPGAAQAPDGLAGQRDFEL